MTSDAKAPEAREGERGVSIVHRARSLQARMSSVLALALMGVLVAGILGWYYARAFTRPARVRLEAQAASRLQAQGEMPLPALGPKAFATHLLGPAPPEPAVPKDAGGDGTDPYQSAASSAGESSAMDTAATAATRSLAGSVPAAGPVSASPPNPDLSGAPMKSPARSALKRKLSGPVVSTANSLPVGPAVAAMPAVATAPDPLGSESAASTSVLATLLKPTAVPAAYARVLPEERLLLPKGAFLDCTLETAIDSTLPGMTTCVTATDTFGADGQVVLLERGTKLIGETRGELAQGSARVFVLWTEARTPTGVVVPLASPGTDELGRSGLPGEVNRHFWQRFGAAILISVIEGSIQAAAQAHSNGGSIIYNPSASGVMTEVLRSTINIPPTVVKHNGDRIQILVARDLDFRSVYELRARSHGP